MRIISLSVLLLISTQVMAYKVISEHVKCLGKADCGVNVISEQVTNQKKSLSYQPTGVLVEIKNKLGKVNEFIKIDAKHHVELNNPTNEKQLYYYKMTLMCIDDGVEFVRAIELDPGDSVSNGYVPYVAVQKNKPGKYGISTEGTLSGSGSGYSSRSAELTVTG